MRKFAMLALILLLSTRPAFAADIPPSDASIHKLLDVTQIHKMLDALMPQVDAMMRASVQSALQGKSLDAGEQKIMDAQQGKLIALLKQELSWKNMEPMYLDIYRKSFSQKEVDDMTAFYQSPSGQAVIMKMPVVMQQSMQIMQIKMQAFMPQIQQISQDTANEIKAYNASKK